MNERVVLFAPEAKDDLLRLYDRIVETAGAVTALAYVGRIEAFCRSMNIASARGTRRDEIRPGLRIVAFERRVTVAFTVTQTNVTILRLFYAGRSWEGSFG